MDSLVSSQKPALSLPQIVNLSFGFFGIQIGFALQNANISRIFQTLGASIDDVPLLWIAGPVTGLLIQPVVGYFSDRTWGRLGRRRPFFLIGAAIAAVALFVMPNAPILWVAAVMLWILDASLNVTMEPFRALVADMLPYRQRTLGYSMQTVFIGAGAVLASLAPFVLNSLGVANTAPPGEIPDNVKYSFYIGGAALLAAVYWTVFTTREYSPAQQEAFATDAGSLLDAETARLDAPRPGSAFFRRWGFGTLFAGLGWSAAVHQLRGDQQFYVLGGGLVFLGLLLLINSWLVRRDAGARNFLSGILGDLATMPSVMKRLAVVQFFAWVAMIILWIYTNAAVALQAWDTTDASSAAFQQAGDWVGVMFAVQNGVAAVYACVFAALARRTGIGRLHAANLVIGAAGFAGYLVFDTPATLLIPMVALGMTWGSILALPYAILADALPPRKMGVYMGIFNFFIVLPQLLVAGTMGPLLRTLEPTLGAAAGGTPLLAALFGAGSLLLAAGSMANVRVGKA